MIFQVSGKRLAKNMELQDMKLIEGTAADAMK